MGGRSRCLHLIKFFPLMLLFFAVQLYSIIKGGSGGEKSVFQSAGNHSEQEGRKGEIAREDWLQGKRTAQISVKKRSGLER